MFRATPTWQGSLGGSVLVCLATSLAVSSVLLPTVCTEGRVRAVLGHDGLSLTGTAEAAVVASQVGRCAMDAVW